MCPMVPIALFAAILFAFIELSSATGSDKLVFPSQPVQLYDGQTLNLTFWTNATLANQNEPFDPHENNIGNISCLVNSSSPFTASVDDCRVYYNESIKELSGSFRVKGDILGHADANVVIMRSSNSTYLTDKVHLIVLQKKTTSQFIFLGCLILLVTLNYVNMGCALDMNVIKNTLKMPIGPIVGMITQYVVMPTLSYVTATNLLSEPYLQLGLFTFGCSPGGGASNMWTVLLGGNLDLSITMTFLSTIASLGMMPLWLFTLGRAFFRDTVPRIPFQNIITGLVAMVIPLGIGIIMQRFCPKGTAFCRRILTPFSVSMIIFIVVFGTYANFYMFRLLTWEIAAAAMVNVWTGFFIGLVAARFCGLSWRDAVTVMIETGIQNTGVAIVLLGVSLPKPDGDMAAIIPVTASVMTPIPLTVLWLLSKLFSCTRSNEIKKKVGDKENVSFLPDPNNGQIVSKGV